MKQSEPIKSLQYRAEMYRLLSDCYRNPAKWPDGFESILQDVAQASSPPVDALLQTMAQASKLGREELAVHFAKAMLGPFELLAPPYSSFYLEPDQRLEGAVAGQVAEFYRRAGLEPDQTGPTDQIDLELEFLYYLIFQQIQTKDTQWQERQQSFLERHLLKWGFKFADLLEQGTPSPFYAGLAKLTKAWFKAETEHLGLETGVSLGGETNLKAVIQSNQDLKDRIAKGEANIL